MPGKQRANEYLQYLQQQAAQTARQNALNNALIVQTMLAQDIRNRQNTPQQRTPQQRTPQQRTPQQRTPQQRTPSFGHNFGMSQQSDRDNVKLRMENEYLRKELNKARYDKRQPKRPPKKNEQTEAATDLVSDLIPSASVGKALYQASQSGDTTTTATYLAQAMLAGAPIAMAAYSQGIRAAAAAAMGINLPGNARGNAQRIDINNMYADQIRDAIAQGYDDAEGGNII